MAKYRLDCISALAHQMAFTPHEPLLSQLSSAEVLLTELDPAKAYPYEFVLFRITGYQPRRVKSELLTGVALQHDLGLLIELVSEQLGLLTTALAEPVLAIADLTERLGVTSKTIQRWRRRGLPARRFIYPDGKRRVGFVLSSVERFLQGQREPLDCALTTSEASIDELHLITRHARRLALQCHCSPEDLARRIARRFNRSPLSILHLIRRHDLENPKRAILPLAASEPTETQRTQVLRAHANGTTIGDITAQLNLSRSAAHRILLADRVKRLSKRRVRFIDDPLYHQDDAERIIDAIAAQHEIVTAAPTDTARFAADVPAAVADLCRAPLLSPPRERGLFLKLNFHKMRFVAARRRLDPELAGNRDIAILESHLRKTVETRNEIVRANLRLVVSVARRHMRGGLSLMELISDGTMTLMRAVDSFDLHRGNKFSTYATLALMKGYARSVHQMLAARISRGEADDLLGQVPDQHTPTTADRFLVREQVTDLLRNLDTRERDVLRAHFGLDQRTPATYDQLARQLGLSKQRIRQIEQAALAKLRASAG